MLRNKSFSVGVGGVYKEELLDRTRNWEGTERERRENQRDGESSREGSIQRRVRVINQAVPQRVCTLRIILTMYIGLCVFT